MPEDLAERLNGYKLVPIQNLEPTKITNPTHMCSPADRTETFTQVQEDHLRPAANDSVADASLGFQSLVESPG